MNKTIRKPKLTVGEKTIMTIFITLILWFPVLWYWDHTNLHQQENCTNTHDAIDTTILQDTGTLNRTPEQELQFCQSIYPSNLDFTWSTD